jgi:DNA helicase-2/ATP-dependent DNA helicase PcrA
MEDKSLILQSSSWIFLVTISIAYWRFEESTGEWNISVDAVRLSTVHQAKELEWPVVFIPSLIDGKF